MPGSSSPLALCGWLWVLWWIFWEVYARFAIRAKSRESALLRLSHVLPATIGFLLIYHFIFSVFGDRSFYSHSVIQSLGPGITLVGLLFTVWARFHLGKYWSGIVALKEGHRLIRSGPYRWVRHPIYAGFLVGALGAAIAAGTWDAALGFGILFVSLLVKFSREESLLTREFGDEYRQFKKDVPALIPRIF
jgi:protein-S-isoprenylcysteine O-methyltransferase Ste14